MIKQIIVIRKDLKMRKGKMIAQGAHASMKVLLDCQITSAHGGCERVYEFSSAINEWLNGQFTKICVSVNSEEELDALYSKAKELHIPCAMIVDAGKTEFNGVPTKTCIAIGPATADIIDRITGGLPLL
jgi:PTH2 family peptidyl-tRNA hydrolase